MPILTSQSLFDYVSHPTPHSSFEFFKRRGIPTSSISVGIPGCRFWEKVCTLYLWLPAILLLVKEPYLEVNKRSSLAFQSPDALYMC